MKRKYLIFVLYLVIFIFLLLNKKYNFFIMDDIKYTLLFFGIIIPTLSGLIGILLYKDFNWQKYPIICGMIEITMAIIINNDIRLNDLSYFVISFIACACGVSVMKYKDYIIKEIHEFNKN